MKFSAKMFLSGAALASCVVALSAVVPVQAQNTAPQASGIVCLDPQDIKGTQAKDSRTILFHMRDGTTWRNTLVAPCPSLMSQNSWTQRVHNDRICANQQQITIAQTGEVCRLGAFTRAN